ncbi:hypothetical protein QBC37DRAFT_381425 [Rhypophila decipiens]|uniref:Uncharacterized protein n=1 Tax=Rhypophila decipiens TaxID=261697 RepID=A0AAN7B0T2_9PEZI|nr:hypothetical protein QBC37DRAFT_381425 [Rhypophila decipiens]
MGQARTSPQKQLLTGSTRRLIQVVKQVNYGPQEWIRYFVPNDSEFMEATEDALLKANFEKVNSYKNFRCTRHNKFFELNLYQKNATNAHHWRSNLARPSRDIDLAFRKEEDSISSSPVVTTSQDPVSATITTSDSTKEGDGDHTPPTLGESGLECVTPGTKLALQLLLPHLQKGLVSNEHPSGGLRQNGIMLLLALEKVNTDMNLGMDLEHLWTTQLENHLCVLSLFWNCVFLESKKSGVDLDICDLGEVIMPAVHYFKDLDQCTSPSPPGRERLQALADKVLAAGRRDRVDWVVKFGHPVERVMESGVPGEDVAKALYRGARHTGQIIVKKWEEEPYSAEGHSESIQKQKSVERDEKNRSTELDNEDENDDDDYPSRDEYYGHHDDDYLGYSSWQDSSPSPNKDFTACDKECGYCGQCDY